MSKIVASTPPLRLTNPHAPPTPTQKVVANIAEEIWSYFFRRVLAGHRGAPQNLIAQFFQKLYDECKNRNIQPVWDVDNEQLIAGIVADLNFNRGADAGRRSADGTPKRERKSPPRKRDTGATERSGAQAPNGRNDSGEAAQPAH